MRCASVPNRATSSAQIPADTSTRSSGHPCAASSSLTTDQLAQAAATAAVLLGQVHREEAGLGDGLPQLVGLPAGDARARGSTRVRTSAAMSATAARSIACSSGSVKSIRSGRVGVVQGEQLEQVAVGVAEVHRRPTLAVRRRPRHGTVDDGDAAPSRRSRISATGPSKRKQRSAEPGVGALGVGRDRARRRDGRSGAHAPTWRSATGSFPARQRSWYSGLGRQHPVVPVDGRLDVGHGDRHVVEPLDRHGRIVTHRPSARP